ncbi:hypothetical protein M5X04_26985 [Paenibacillus alvei]|uniref:Uncharacterized protein n=1 Tax=Paenibacillus alvei TaxID=44250 RepID=A0ABT4EGV9_PAEAL|nr:hypothetical protein [Paenibacillus alvei]MCY9532959.1 hypothetical protein [Paenibacillus alvei]
MGANKGQVEKIIVVLDYAKSVILREGEMEYAELKRRDRNDIFDYVEESFCLNWDGEYWILDTSNFVGDLADIDLVFDISDGNACNMRVGFGVSEGASVSSIDALIAKLRGLVAQEAINIVNLTPHTINIMSDGSDGEITSIPSSGEARATTTREHYGTINGIQIYRTSFGAVQGLPKPQKDTIYIVSSITAQAVPDRDDVFIPDDIVRDEQGRVIGCRALGRI